MAKQPLKITQITAQKREGRFNVFLNGKYAFPVSEDVLLRFHLFKGQEVVPSQVNEIKNADEISKLYNKGIDFIAYSPRSVHQVREKLTGLSDNADAVDAAVLKLKAVNLLDDEKFAEAYVKGVASGGSKGPLACLRYLNQKGVSEKIANQAVSQFYPADLVIKNGKVQAANSFKHYQNNPFAKKLIKVKTALNRKGYSFDDIDTIMEDLDFTPDPGKQASLLEREGEKLWHKYRKHSFWDRRQRTKRALFSRGFDLDEIDNFLADKQEGEG